jgi:hypothetical protein
MNAIDFECPVCGAKVGERCHTFTGKALPVTHAKRKWLAANVAQDEDEPQPFSPVTGDTPKSS